MTSSLRLRTARRWIWLTRSAENFDAGGSPRAPVARQSSPSSSRLQRFPAVAIWLRSAVWVQQCGARRTSQAEGFLQWAVTLFRCPNRDESPGNRGDGVEVSKVWRELEKPEGLRPQGSDGLNPRPVCHAEGRGFESHHPLFETPCRRRVFLRRDRRGRLRASPIVSFESALAAESARTFAHAARWCCRPHDTTALRRLASSPGRSRAALREKAARVINPVRGGESRKRPVRRERG